MKLISRKLAEPCSHPLQDPLACVLDRQVLPERKVKCRTISPFVCSLLYACACAHSHLLLLNISAIADIAQHSGNVMQLVKSCTSPVLGSPSCCKGVCLVQRLSGASKVPHLYGRVSIIPRLSQKKLHHTCSGLIKSVHGVTTRDPQ